MIKAKKSKMSQLTENLEIILLFLILAAWTFFGFINR